MATTNMKAGRLRHRVRIEALRDLLDSSGQVIQDPVSGEVSRAWILVAEVWAAVEPLSAREFIQSNATQAAVTARITIRYRENLDASMRLVHNGRIYNPVGFLSDADSGLEYLTIPAAIQGPSEGQ